MDIITMATTATMGITAMATGDMGTGVVTTAVGAGMVTTTITPAACTCTAITSTTRRVTTTGTASKPDCQTRATFGQHESSRLVLPFFVRASCGDCVSVLGG